MKRRQFLFGRKDPNRRRVAAPYGARAGDWPGDEAVVRDFDEVTEEEVEMISDSVGASGARRPPSE